MTLFERIKVIHSCRKELLLAVKTKIDLIAFQKKWRLQNQKNGTIAKNKFDSSIVSIGEETYGELRVIGFGNPNEKLTIGNFCSIAGDVTFLLGGEHPLDKISTFPLSTHVWKMDETSITPTKGPIVVEDDVWICHGATILSGVRIGQGAVIGAGAVVSKDVPPYAIVVGDGLIKRWRFNDRIIESFLRIDLRKVKKFDIEKRKFLQEAAVNDSNIELIMKWFG